MNKSDDWLTWLKICLMGYVLLCKEISQFLKSIFLQSIFNWIPCTAIRSSLSMLICRLSHSSNNLRLLSKLQKWWVWFPGGTVVKNLPDSAGGDPGDASSILGTSRSPGVGNGSPPQYSCLENSMDRGACYSPATVCVQHKELDTIERLSSYTHTAVGKNFWKKVEESQMLERCYKF